MMSSASGTAVSNLPQRARVARPGITPPIPSGAEGGLPAGTPLADRDSAPWCQVRIWRVSPAEPLRQAVEPEERETARQQKQPRGRGGEYDGDLGPLIAKHELCREMVVD